ncbi:hypothetical protein GGI25_003552 [Coemansia spiralis]|uniref:PEBP-like protein n=2 Tax=Coemansia TaxID=4863 RepID=A0A9W8G1Y4_9FUNG|nr:phosphatidylethanolamine-binding protein [Coemansia spiralis]KAJ1990442.1 hypothetical protein EDC05_004086 [Coemansia umbellata]KAJ2622071.1 hypothetical protein GGI26_003513 [Coemansia sp. RSA 1358]KAJ2676517.1 hypothetical protein GGI25_003552 [Coemansia spiralis]
MLLWCALALLVTVSAHPSYKELIDPYHYEDAGTLQSTRYPSDNYPAHAPQTGDTDYQQPQMRLMGSVQPSAHASLHVGPDPNNPLAPYLLTSDNQLSAETKPAIEETKHAQIDMVRSRLEESQLIPQVLPTGFAPEFSITLKYNNRVVEPGQLLLVNETQYEPTVEFDAEPNQVFAVTIVDPDSPSRAKHGYRSYRHFLAANLDAVPTNPSDILTTYQPPNPSFMSGPHRYLALVFRQPRRLKFAKEDVPETRVRFDPLEWARSFNMKPVAAHFFTVQRFHINE